MIGRADLQSRASNVDSSGLSRHWPVPHAASGCSIVCLVRSGSPVLRHSSAVGRDADGACDRHRSVSVTEPHSSRRRRRQELQLSMPCCMASHYGHSSPPSQSRISSGQSHGDALARSWLYRLHHAPSRAAASSHSAAQASTPPIAGHYLSARPCQCPRLGRRRRRLGEPPLSTSFPTTPDPTDHSTPELPSVRSPCRARAWPPLTAHPALS